MALTLSAIDSSWEFWGGACWWGRRLIRLHEFQQWCWWCEPVPFVILDLDGVRTLLLCEGQLKRMSHHPHLLVPSDQLSCFDVRRWRLAVSTLCSGMAYRKHLQCQRSGYALVLPSPPSWPVCSSWCGARDLHFFLPPFLQRCLGCHLPVCIFLWWWWGIFGHSNGRFWSSSTCCSLDDVYIHILYRQWCTGKRFAPGLCVLLPDDPPVWELLREHLFQLDLSHGSALFGHVAMVQGSWTPPKYHNVVACGPCFLCFSLIIAYTTRFLLLPAVEWYLPFSWCLCWRSYNDGDELASSSLGFSDLIVDLLRRRPAGQWSFDHWS